MRFLLFAFIVASATACHSSRNIFDSQSVAVKGRLLCNGLPASNILIKIYDVDTANMDDKMAQGVSDATGAFSLSGWARDFDGQIEPRINIYHRCASNAVCDRKSWRNIPSKVISDGKIPAIVFDFGNIELSQKQDGEEIDCVH